MKNDVVVRVAQNLFQTEEFPEGFISDLHQYMEQRFVSTGCFVLFSASEDFSAFMQKYPQLSCGMREVIYDNGRLLFREDYHDRHFFPI